ncbi:MAG: hypothetical protein LUO89_14400 [Methanothrix sp.]|nr:hypothetical protein [Methanothrix sp.]
MTTALEEDANLSYAYGLAALQFFAFPGEAQVASWHKVANQKFPWFFREHEQADRSSYYFFGVGCVWTTYKNYLYDQYSDKLGPRELDSDHSALTDFNHFESIHACTGDAVRWSEADVLEEGNDMWEGLRKYARLALAELGEALPAEAPTFIIEDLVNPDEFRTSNAVLEILERYF